MASYESPNRHWREIFKQMFVCQSIERNGKGAEIGKGRSSHGKLTRMESSKNVLSISVENPMVIPLSLSSVMYTQYIPVFILLFFSF